MAAAPHQRSVFQSPPGTDTGVWSHRFPGPQADVSISKEIASLNVTWCFPATGEQILIRRDVYKPLPETGLWGAPDMGGQCSRGCFQGNHGCVSEEVGGERGAVYTLLHVWTLCPKVPWNQGQLAS